MRIVLCEMMKPLRHRQLALPFLRCGVAVQELQPLLGIAVEEGYEHLRTGKIGNQLRERGGVDPVVRFYWRFYWVHLMILTHIRPAVKAHFPIFASSGFPVQEPYDRQREQVKV